MALGSDDLNYIRSMLPSVATTDGAYVTDTQLNYLYTNKAGSDLDKTIAYALKQMCAKLSNKVARANTATGDTVQAHQEREAVCALANEWASATGILGREASVGSISLGIDEEDTLLSNP